MERFKNLYGAMLAIIDIFPKEKKRFDNFTNVFAKELHERDEIICNAFKKLDEKLEPIAFTVMLLSLKAKKGPVTQKDREEVSEMFGYVWDDESERDFLDTIRV